MHVAGLAAAVAAAVASAHGVTDKDRAFLEQNSGHQLIVFMYLGARSQHQASGTLNTPFDGSHGWYWLNRGSEAVTVQVNVTGFQEKLYRPGQQ